MVPIIVILTIIAFVIADAAVRLSLEKLALRRLVKERQHALDAGLKLRFAEEAPSLKRVEVEQPKARILAVDDEPIVLDSFRKVLVLDGYCIDTVETGAEALALVGKHDYDFVFTDLKMPEMDGVEVTKAVKYLRPDIDVVIITGFATIESAVETMKHGALDYVQKPFTPDELTEFTNKCLIRRQERHGGGFAPQAVLVSSGRDTRRPDGGFTLWAGIFLSPGHLWVSIEPGGVLKIGLDDFSQKTLGKAHTLTLPREGSSLAKGEPLFSFKAAWGEVSIPTPVSGEVESVNKALREAPQLLYHKPYESGWICRMRPSRLAEELRQLKIGDEALAWYQAEITRWAGDAAKRAGSNEGELMRAFAHDYMAAR